MRTRSKQLLRSLIFGGVLAFSIASGDFARAEADTFGVGNGHNGAFTATGPEEVVNAYAPITADVSAGATQIAFGNVVGATAGFVVGDLVLVWRATGVDATLGGVASGNQTALPLANVEGNSVGNWELARISAVVGSTMTLSKPLVNAWAKNVTQVVKVPEYTTVSVPAGTGVRAAAWQPVGAGFAGGILAFMASGTVTLTGTGRLDASARGFRGGNKVNRTAVVTDCPNLDGTVEQGYAPKGESVVATKNTAGEFTGPVYGDNVGGRGNRSIGAGGGNCVENGGAGGGNAAQGGKGGDSAITGAVGTNRGGLGGAAIQYSLANPENLNARTYSRVTMGGGGGAGEQKNGVGSAGGHGGGVIFVRANALAGDGTISANGEDALNATLANSGLESDGAGGGGAGGTVLLRVVTAANCGALEVKGGAGGDSQVLALGVFGPGGGGAGGRALLQSDSGTCAIVATPGAPGKSGGLERGATAGGAGAGTVIPAAIGGLCTTNAAPSQCANPNPACDVDRGFCSKCDGPFGGTSDLRCPEPGSPVCSPTNGTCVICQRDNGVPGEDACQLSAAPYCETTGPNAGECGKCENDADCTGPTHPGPKCNPAAGACGTACAGDGDCKNTEWCAQGVCIPKTPNSQPVSNLPPDTNGECTPQSGERTCLSAVCEPDDDLCGLKNGSDCDGVAEKCRSTICFPTDELCGKPAGEPCAGDGECRSENCNNGLCTGCDEDRDCPIDRICDKGKNECVPGCRPGAQSTDAGSGDRGLCPPGQDCVATDGGDIGTCVPGTDAGADGGGLGDAGDTYNAGLVEGGGCACRTSLASSGSPFAIFAAAGAALLAARRRRSRRNQH